MMRHLSLELIVEVMLCPYKKLQRCLLKIVFMLYVLVKQGLKMNLPSTRVFLKYIHTLIINLR